MLTGFFVCGFIIFLFIHPSATSFRQLQLLVPGEPASFVVMKWFFKYKLHHILFWLVYAAFMYWMVITTPSRSNQQTILLFMFVYFIAQIICTYIALYWLLPRYFNRQRYVMFVVAMLLNLAINAGWPMLGNLYFPASNMGVVQLFLYRCLSNSYIMLGAIGAKIAKDKIISDRRNQLLLQEKMKQELRFLRGQMNPHFLFNAINSIYVLIRKDPEMAAQTLANFSDMLRYQLYESNMEHTPITKELDYLDHYIALEKLRKGDMLEVHYSVSDTVRELQIAPLLIIPIVENAFKHISSHTHSKNKIYISMDYKTPLFTLRVENSKDAEPSNTTGGGIGQANVRRRLELLYPDAHRLEIVNEDEKYVVLMEIKIT